MSKQRILIINTGGTISSIRTEEGYRPHGSGLSDALSDIKELKKEEMPHYELVEFTPLLDSSNMSLVEWQRLADIIYQQYEHYDGFVVLHGTDTMAYTASALSFMCHQLAKPIIITGSQLPLCEIRSDAKDNIITALWLAQSNKLYEVAIYFNQTLLRGNRTQKTSSSRFSAFSSPNYPPLAICGTHIEWQDDALRDKPTGPFEIHPIHDKVIANFKLFPGCQTALLQHLLDYPLDALILETYGSGNAKTDKDFIAMLESSADKGILILNCTQCHHGGVNMSTYATGKTLAEAGVIDGGDMTTEAAHTKLLYVLSNEHSHDLIRLRITQDLRGERT